MKLVDTWVAVFQLTGNQTIAWAVFESKIWISAILVPEVKATVHAVTALNSFSLECTLFIYFFFKETKWPADT